MIWRPTSTLPSAVTLVIRLTPSPKRETTPPITSSQLRFHPIRPLDPRVPHAGARGSRCHRLRHGDQGIQHEVPEAPVGELGDPLFPLHTATLHHPCHRPPSGLSAACYASAAASCHVHITGIHVTRRGRNPCGPSLPQNLNPKTHLRRDDDNTGALAHTSLNTSQRGRRAALTAMVRPLKNVSENTPPGVCTK